MTHSGHMRGFTMIEILVSIGVIGIIVGISAVGLQNWQAHAARKVAVQDVYMKLRAARGMTLGAENDTVYGVRVASSSVTRFTGSTYDVNSSSNDVYVFEAGVSATGTLVGRNVVFERLTGKPNATGTVLVRNREGNATSTITLFSSGLVDY